MGKKKALRNFQSLLIRELGKEYEWNGIGIERLTELLRIGMLTHPQDLSSRKVGELVLVSKDCEDNDWCLTFNVYGRSWTGHLHVTLVNEEDIWIILIVNDFHGRHTITWSISIDDLLGLGGEN